MIAAISRYVAQRPRVVERVNFIGLRITRTSSSADSNTGRGQRGVRLNWAGIAS
ncbi:Uncharacterised protein [Mycobacteroides abscessus subsp. abscessus]|nr:Uncharacterised protein [Mycobacteroides abscessus subsp. abscessus]